MIIYVRYIIMAAIHTLAVAKNSIYITLFYPLFTHTVKQCDNPCNIYKRHQNCS